MDHHNCGDWSRITQNSGVTSIATVAVAARCSLLAEKTRKWADVWFMKSGLPGENVNPLLEDDPSVIGCNS